MITLNRSAADQMRKETKRRDRTKACPMCDDTVPVQAGISLPVVCVCGNVWQPAQMCVAWGMPAQKTCVSRSAPVETSEADKLRAVLVQVDREAATP